MIKKAGSYDDSGVFEYMNDEAAFIDRLELGVWGKRRARPLSTISVVRTLAIGGPDRIYVDASDVGSTKHFN